MAESPKADIQLEYFPFHGRAMCLRMILWYCDASFDNKFSTPEEFGANKAAGKYPLGQLPVLYIEKGVQLAQTNSIARYLAKRFTGKNGEKLYPNSQDPMLLFKLEEVMDI